MQTSRYAFNYELLTLNWIANFLPRGIFQEFGLSLKLRLLTTPSKQLPPKPSYFFFQKYYTTPTYSARQHKSVSTPCRRITATPWPLCPPINRIVRMQSRNLKPRNVRKVAQVCSPIYRNLVVVTFISRHQFLYHQSHQETRDLPYRPHQCCHFRSFQQLSHPINEAVLLRVQISSHRERLIPPRNHADKA